MVYFFFPVCSHIFCGAFLGVCMLSPLSPFFVCLLFAIFCVVCLAKPFSCREGQKWDKTWIIFGKGSEVPGSVAPHFTTFFSVGTDTLPIFQIFLLCGPVISDLEMSLVRSAAWKRSPGLKTWTRNSFYEFVNYKMKIKPWKWPRQRNNSISFAPDICLRQVWKSKWGVRLSFPVANGRLARTQMYRKASEDRKSSFEFRGLLHEFHELSKCPHLCPEHLALIMRLYPGANSHYLPATSST